MGCGTTALSRPGYWDEQISDEQYTAEASYVREHHGVELRDKEHLTYYRVFRCDILEIKVHSWLMVPSNNLVTAGCAYLPTHAALEESCLQVASKCGYAQASITVRNNAIGRGWKVRSQGSPWPLIAWRHGPNCS